MIAIPAVDLRDGACMQAAGEPHAREQLGAIDPIAAARSWTLAGFRRLHVMDLDAAADTGSNAAIIEELLHDSPSDVQVGGGVESGDQVQAWLDLGAARVVVGDRALDELAWVEGLAATFPGQIVVATDVRERRVVTRGWVRTLPLDILDVIETLNGLPLAGVLVIARHLQGRLEGTDLSLMEDVAEASDCPVIAAGGVTTMNDLRALEHRGLAGAVIGMALYSGALDPRAVASEFVEN